MKLQRFIMKVLFDTKDGTDIDTIPVFEVSKEEINRKLYENMRLYKEFSLYNHNWTTKEIVKYGYPEILSVDELWETVKTEEVTKKHQKYVITAFFDTKDGTDVQYLPIYALTKELAIEEFNSKLFEAVEDNFTLFDFDWSTKEVEKYGVPEIQTITEFFKEDGFV